MTLIVTDPSKPLGREEEGVIVTVAPLLLPGVKVRLPTVTLFMAAGAEPEFFIVSVIVIFDLPVVVLVTTTTVGVPIIWTPALVFPKLPNRPKAKTATAKAKATLTMTSIRAVTAPEIALLDLRILILGLLHSWSYIYKKFSRKSYGYQLKSKHVTS
jgi:hypothetical protein